MALNNVIIKGKDTVVARLAECFITIGDRRYNFMQMINCEFTLSVNVTTVPILGKMMNGHKVTSLEGKGKATAQYNTSVIRKMVEAHKNTALDTYFDVQITNEDVTSAAGRQTLQFIDCLIEGDTVLSKFDADGETLDEDINFTFEDFKMPESFNLLPGM
jgi:hypothetical protein